MIYSEVILLENTYQIGEKVVHIPEGVCIISEITKMISFGEEKEYYKLIPVMDDSRIIYVGINRPSKNIRRLRNKDEIQKILDVQKASRSHWEKNEEKRCNLLKTAIQKDDGQAIAKIIKTYYQRRRIQKLNTTDSNLLKKAEQLLYSEIAEVLQTDFQKLRTHILEQTK